MSFASTSCWLPRHSPKWEQLTQPFWGKRMPLCGVNWPASIWLTVASTSCPNSRRCWSLMVVLRYWISETRLRTKATTATSEIPLIQE